MRRIAVILAALASFFAASAVAVRRVFRTRENIDWIEAPGPGHTLEVEGVRLHYVERAPPIGGDAPAIVMVHGFGGHTFSFRYQLADLGQDYRCVAIDLKGFGYSERVDGGDYSLTEQARLVLAAMDKLGIEKATLVGHSMGGEVIMRMAAQAPHRVERLILAASVSGDRAPLAPRLPFMRPLLTPMTKLIALTAFQRMFYDKSRLDIEEIRRGYLGPPRIRGSANTVWQMWGSNRNRTPIDFASITQPVLILWAERERILPVPGRLLKRLQKHFTHATTEEIPRSGHLLLEEQPEACNAAIRAFIEGEARPAQAAGAVEEQVA